MQKKTEYETARIKFREEQLKAADVGDKTVEAAKKTTQGLPTLSIEEATKLLEDSDQLVYAEVMAEFKKLRERLTKRIEE